MSKRPKPGDQFTHDRFIEPGWKPSRTQVWKDAPKARMQVLDVDRGMVTYTYVGRAKAAGRHQTFSMPQAAFLATYGDRLQPHLTVVDGGGYTELMDELTTRYNGLRAVRDLTGDTTT